VSQKEYLQCELSHKKNIYSVKCHRKNTYNAKCHRKNVYIVQCQRKKVEKTKVRFNFRTSKILLLGWQTSSVALQLYLPQVRVTTRDHRGLSQCAGAQCLNGEWQEAVQGVGCPNIQALSPLTCYHLSTADRPIAVKLKEVTALYNLSYWRHC
jgi:hypothetical protein